MDSILTDFEFHFLAFWKVFINSLCEKCKKKFWKIAAKNILN